MDSFVRTPQALQACIGKPAGPRDAKVIDHLDDGAQRWIGHSPLLFIALERQGRAEITLAGGPPGFVQVHGPHRLRLPRARVDDAALLEPGLGFGTLFLVPGLGETLRVNGRIADVGPEFVDLCVEECFMHCAKALIRSGFWTDADGAGAAPKAATAAAATTALPTPPLPDWARHLAASRLLALATSDGQGHVDLSPKGDPAGLLIHSDGSSASFAERPGNRRTDSFLNILAQPRLALAALVPGRPWVVVLRGTAQLTQEDRLRAPLAVDGKLPLLATRLHDLQAELRHSPALEQARLWPAAAAPADLDPAALFAGHVRANRDRGVGMLLARTLVSIPGLMRRGLDSDYKKNLY